MKTKFYNTVKVSAAASKRLPKSKLNNLLAYLGGDANIKKDIRVSLLNNRNVQIALRIYDPNYCNVYNLKAKIKIKDINQTSAIILSQLSVWSDFFDNKTKIKITEKKVENAWHEFIVTTYKRMPEQSPTEIQA